MPAAVSPSRLVFMRLLAVLVFGDALADPVLLAIDSSLFSFRQMAVVLRHVSLFAVLHSGFAIFEIGCLLRVQLAAADALGNTLLLIFFPLIHFIHARMTRIDNARARSRGGCGLSRSGTG